MISTTSVLADMLGRADLDFENFYLLNFLGFPIYGFPGSQISKIWPGPGYMMPAHDVKSTLPTHKQKAVVDSFNTVVCFMKVTQNYMLFSV